MTESQSAYKLQGDNVFRDSEVSGTLCVCVDMNAFRIENACVYYGWLAGVSLFYLGAS